MADDPNTHIVNSHRLVRWSIVVCLRGAREHFARPSHSIYATMLLYSAQWVTQSTELPFSVWNTWTHRIDARALPSLAWGPLSFDQKCSGSIMPLQCCLSNEFFGSYVFGLAFVFDLGSQLNCSIIPFCWFSYTFCWEAFLITMLD